MSHASRLRSISISTNGLTLAESWRCLVAQQLQDHYLMPLNP